MPVSAIAFLRLEILACSSVIRTLQEQAMSDLIYLALGLGSFVLFGLAVRGCARI
ncbi:MULTISPECIES: hypothetical protein [unclassified Thalassospira]|uniref:hypothetical protein n=1 Tax=unclassified Thalassospira TaxID=2648997 RepID=UPI00143D1796|nr:hypothetical protein [Thalassospira sp. MCCC 1A01428]